MIVCKTILLEHVFALVIEDETNPLCVSLQIAAATLNVFLIFCPVSSDQILALNAEDVKNLHNLESAPILIPASFFFPKPLSCSELPFALGSH